MNLSIFSTLHEKVKKYKQIYDLESDSIAYEWLVLETILHLNQEEIEEAITDGSMDGGIDSIYIKDKNVYFFSFKYANSFEQTNKNFPENDLNSLLGTVHSIYSKNTEENQVNEALWEKINEIWEQFNTLGALTFKFYICSNKIPPIEHARKKFETALSQYKFVEFYYLTPEELVNKIIEKKYKSVNGKFNFVDKQYFERSDGNVRGIVGTISGLDLINLIADQENPQKIQEDVFNDNIRLYQPENDINKKIIKTALSDDNYQFWYLNNGITIVCDECIFTPNSRSPLVELKNFQIVNGGQTSHALFEAFLQEKEKIDNILLLVRICESKHGNKISEKISESTNSQTPVKSRDLRSNDDVQRRLEEEFRDLGYFYESKENKYIDEDKSRRLNNELLAQLYLSFYLSLPSEAKNNKSVIFGERYREIFNENEITASKMLLPYLLWLPLQDVKKDIQRKKRKKETVNEEDSFVSRATFHIVYMCRVISEKKGYDLNNENDQKRALKEAKEILKQIVLQEMVKRKKLYTHDKFFKEMETQRIIHNYLENLFRS
ncbi:MAG: AIPR family protein [Leptospiraceae bacterium]|nr:AIPR family protein [Leptospiraceae bacterium]